MICPFFATLGLLPISFLNASARVLRVLNMNRAFEVLSILIGLWPRSLPGHYTHFSPVHHASYFPLFDYYLPSAGTALRTWPDFTGLANAGDQEPGARSTKYFPI